MKGIIKRLLFGNQLYASVYSRQIKAVTSRFTKEWPRDVNIEITNKCNSRCTICAHSVMKRKQGMMSMRLFRKIIDDCEKEGISKVIVSGFGEPFLDRHIYERINYAKAAGLPLVKLSTNGSLLASPKKVLESGLDEIDISFDGFTKETYNRIRVGLDFDAVKRNITKLLEEKRRLKLTKPRIRVRLVANGENDSEVDAFRKEWSGVADDVLVSFAENWTGAVPSRSYHGPKYACKEPFLCLAISWTGLAVACHLDYEMRNVIGDMNKQSIFEIRESKKLQELRQAQLSRKFSSINVCKDCSKTERNETIWWYR